MPSQWVSTVLNWLRPWQKMVISAEFDGILPSQTREIAHAAKDHFDDLYLVVDQQKPVEMRVPLLIRVRVLWICF